MREGKPDSDKQQTSLADRFKVLLFLLLHVNKQTLLCIRD